jgi:biofilm PGA synthesis protein PgaD
MKDNLIIDKPEAQQRSQRIAQGLLTVGFWFLFLSLLRPLLALIGWLVGIHLFTHEMIEQNGGWVLIETLRNYGLVVLLMAVVLRSWAWYNHRRFAGKDQRRRTMAPISLEVIARYHQVDPSALALWQKDRRLFVRHNAQGQVLEVQASEPPLWDGAIPVTLAQHALSSLSVDGEGDPTSLPLPPGS